MDMKLIFMALIFAAYVAAKLYVKFDHSGWDEGSSPSSDAGITDERVDKVNVLLSRRYMDSHGNNYFNRKITFTFSDGFYYTSYKMKLPSNDDILAYHVNSSEWVKLREKALEAHALAVSEYRPRRKLNLKSAVINVAIIAVIASCAFFLLKPMISIMRANSAIKNGEYEKGIVLLRENQSSESGRESLRDAWMAFADSEIFAMAGRDIDYDLARERGGKLRAVDAQLKYCHALQSAGYDLNKVYPFGVEVEDAGLESYHITNLKNISGDKLDTSRVIVFRREQLTVPKDDAKTEEDSAVSYSVRLMPGSMFVAGTERVAKSFGEATCVVLADSVYVESGAIVETSVPSGTGVYTMDMDEYTRRMTSRRMPYYAAIDTLTAYDKSDPSAGKIMMTNVNDAPCSDSSWQASHLGIDKGRVSDYDRFGRFNSDEMMKSLDTAMTLWLLGVI